MSFVKQKLFFNKKSAGLTLIELLVVIAVISLLSSIVIVATKGARERASIAAIQQFSASIRHALGAYVVGEWKFEDNLDDTFGENNRGFFMPSGSPTYGDGIVGKALSFDGSHYIEVPDSPSLGPRSDAAVTIEAWVKANDFAGYPMIALREPHFYLYFDNGKLEFDLETLTCYCMLKTADSLETGKWYHIVATCIPKNTLKIYLNGKEVASKNTCPCGDLYNQPYDAPLFIGGCNECSTNFNGIIEEVRVYNESFPPL